MNIHQGKRYLLLMTGAMSPPHRGHVEAMRLAYEHLKSEGAEVIESYLSPSHDLYVRTKNSPLPREARLKLAEHVIKACGASDWLQVSSWESSPEHTYWPDFDEVIKWHQDDVNKREKGVEVVYVCGVDHMRYCGHVKHLIAIERQDAQAPHDERETWHVLSAHNDETATLSSTVVNKLARSPHGSKSAKLQELSRWLGAEGAAYFYNLIVGS